jgi:hypothetical protein
MKAHLSTAGDIPVDVLAAAGHAFAAGRFELACPGHHPWLKHKDVVAAYSWAMLQLPCLAHGKWWPTPAGTWIHRDQHPTLRLVSWKVPSNPSRPFGPFPWRYPDGVACYPRQGAGWVWSPEWEAAAALWGPECFTVHDAWTFVPSCDHHPWEWLRPLIEKRADFPPLKNFLNAIPGKLMQTRPVTGPWWDPVAAGLTTSIVRARMLTEAAAAGSSCVAITADALWLRREPKCSQTHSRSSEHGQSEDGPEGSFTTTSSSLSGTTTATPGTLKTTIHDDVLAVAGGGLFFEGQNVAASAGTPAKALDGFRRYFDQAWAEAGIEAKVRIPYRHFVLPSEAAQTGLTVGSWHIQHRDVGFSQGRKRDEEGCKYKDGRAITRPPAVPDWDLIVQTGGDPAGRLVGGQPMSYPYWSEKGEPLCPEVGEGWPLDGDELHD